MTSSPLPVFLTSYFSRLNGLDLSYGVMRNYEGLPDEKVGNDIDVMIEPRDLTRHMSVLYESAREEGWQLTQVIVRPYISVLKLVRFGEAASGWPAVLHLDFFPAGSWYGCKFLDAEAALQRRRPFGELPVFVLDPVDEVFHILCHHMVWTGYLAKDKYRRLIREVLASHPSELTRRLRKVFGAKWTQRLIAIALSGGRLRRPEHRALRMAALLRRGLWTLYPDGPIWARSAWAEVRQCMWPPGLIVGVGCGDESASGRAIETALPWLRQLGSRNHGFADIELGRFLRSGNEHADTVIRRHYRHAVASRKRLLNSLRAGRSRGWVVLYPLSDSNRFLLRHTDLLVVDAATRMVLEGSHRSERCVRADLVTAERPPGRQICYAVAQQLQQQASLVVAWRALSGDRRLR